MPAAMRRKITRTETSRRPPSVLERLMPGEAAEVLRRLLVEKPELAGDAERLARSVLGNTSSYSIASAVEDAITSVGMDEVMERSGRDSLGGYTSPDEAAWELLDEALRPFIEDMKRRAALGLHDQAVEICRGVVLGLYHLRKDSGGALEYAPDFVAEAAGNAVDDWRRGMRGRKREVVRATQKALLERAPDWTWLIE